MKSAATLFGAVLVLSALCARASGDDGNDEIIRTIVGKIAERERLFDGVAVRYSLEWRYTHNSLVRTANGRWIKDGDRFLVDIETSYATPEDESRMRTLIRMASDGALGRQLRRSFGSYHATVFPASQRDRYFSYIPLTPERSGITAPPTEERYTLIELLEGEKRRVPLISRRVAERARQVAVVGREAVAGRECIVVELTADIPDGDFARVERLHFAPELNYALVRFEDGTRDPSGYRPKSCWTFGDFRQVKGGLFVPFSGRSERHKWQYEGQNWKDEVRHTSSYRIEDLEFRSTFDESLFAFRFPPDIEIWDYVSSHRIFYGAGSGLWPDDMAEVVLGDLEEQLAPLPKAAATSPPRAPETAAASADETAPPEPDAAEAPGTALPMAAGAAVAVLVVFICALFLRKRAAK